MDIQRKNILHLLREMEESQLIGSDLNQELQKWLSKKSNEEFERDHAPLTRRYNLLKRLKEECDKKKQQQQLDVDYLAQRRYLLYQSLLAHNKDTDYYSAHTILMKLELILFDTVDNFSVSDGDIIPNSILVEIYSTTNNETDFQQSMMVKDEQETKGLDDMKSDDRLYLLNELMNAPLEDITVFLRQFNLSFKDFYTYEIFEEILFRLRNPPKFSNSSDEIIDQLCVYIKKKLTNKYKLNRIELTTLLDDQFYKITPNKYRSYLEQFVQHKPAIQLTLANFFSFHQLDPVLSVDDQNKFGTLFHCYCEKLNGGKKSVPFAQSSTTTVSNSHQDEGCAKYARGRRPKYVQKQEPQSPGYTNYPRNTMWYNNRSKKNVQNPPEAISGRSQVASSVNIRFQNRKNTNNSCASPMNQLSFGFQRQRLRV